MTNSTQTPTTVTNIGVAMFAVADVDAAIAFYTEKLGFELRADVAYGPQGEQRWVEVAPPGSTARLALNRAMEGQQPGGAGIGIETPDADAEFARLQALGVASDPPMDVPGAPKLFMLQDPDGNHIAVVEVPAEA